VAGLLLASASHALAGPTTVACIQYGQIGPGGDDEGKYANMWEYIYDVQGGSNGWTRFVTLSGFDSTLIANLSTNNQGGGDNTLNDVWDGMSAWKFPWWGWQDPNNQPSYWDWGTSTWYLGGNTAIQHLNYWHDGPDYGDGSNFQRYGGYLIEDGVQWDRYWSGYVVTYGVEYTIMTIRLIHPEAPGIIQGSTYSNDVGPSEWDIVGPIPEPATMSLLGLGGLAALLRRRRK